MHPVHTRGIGDGNTRALAGASPGCQDSPRAAPPWVKRMRASAIAAVVVAAVAMSLGQTPAPAPQSTTVTTARGSAARPNIVFILIDDIRSDDLSCTGSPVVRTPNIDRIATEGIVLRNAFVATPLCIPSRASFLTGQYPHTNGIKAADPANDARSQRLTTFPMLLQQAGYETALIGKWHVGNAAVPRPGFDRWVSFRGQGQYLDPELNIDGKQEVVRGYVTDILTDLAVDFIRRPHDKPFLLYLSHKAIHAPNLPPERYKHLFRDVPVAHSPGFDDDLAGKPVLRRGVVLDPNDPDTATTEENVRDRWRCLLAVDDSVRRVWAALEATGQLNRTLIVFTSDNGYFYSEHGLGGKHGPYEEAIRIPMFMRLPDAIQAGRTADALALNIDIAPTLLECAGVSPPRTMSGRSLWPLVTNAPYTPRTAFLAEFFVGAGADVTARFPDWQAVRGLRWKYVRYDQYPGMAELYDLQSDPFELKNLIHDPVAARPVAEMKAELSRLLEETK
jgi:N-acetylglucosamine-6-sulfatase